MAEERAQGRRRSALIFSCTLIVLLRGVFIYYWSSLDAFYMRRDPSGSSNHKLPTCCLFTAAFTGRLVFRQYSKSVNLIGDLLTKLPVSISFCVGGCGAAFGAVRPGIIQVSWWAEGEDDPMTHCSMKHELHWSTRDGMTDRLSVRGSTHTRYSRWSGVQCVFYICTERPLHNGPADPNFRWLHPVRTRHPQRSN